MKAANLFGGAAAECSGASSPVQLSMPFCCVTSQEKQRRTAYLGTWSAWCEVLSGVFSLPLYWHYALRFSRVRLAGCSAPKQCPLRPLTVLLPALLALAPCQTHPLPSVPFGSAEYLSAPRWL